MKRYVGVFLFCGWAVLAAGTGAHQGERLEVASGLVASGDHAYQEGLEQEARALYARAAAELAGTNGATSQKLRHQVMSTCLDRKWTDEALLLAAYEAAPDQLLRLSELLQREGRGAEVLDVYEQLLFPAPPPGSDDLAQAPWHAARFGALRQIAWYQLDGEFVAHYEEAIDRGPENATLRGELGYLLWQAGDYDAAEMELREILATEADQGYSWHSLVASFYRDTGRLSDAVRLLESVRNAPLTDADARSYAMTCAAVLTPGEARAALRSRRLEDLGELRERAGKLKAAEDSYSEIVQVDARGSAKQARKALSEVQDKEAQTSKAIKRLTGDLLKDPADHTVAAQLGGLLFSLGRAQDAAAQYRAALKLEPQEARYHAGLARALAEAGESDEAILEHRRALELLPVVRTRPWLYITEPDYDVCLREVEDLCRWQGRAQVLLAIYSQELARLRAESAPGESALAERVKRNLEKTSDLLRAAGDFGKVLAVWTGEHQRLFQPARRSILRCATRQGNAAALLAQVRDLVGQRPDDYSMRTLCADLLYVTGKTEEALAQYDGVSRDLPAESAFHAELGRIYRERNLPEKALAEYGIVIGHAQAGSTLRRQALQGVARANMELKRFEEAAKLYEQALAQDPSDLHARRHLMACRRAVGQPATIPQALVTEELAKAQALVAAKQFSEAIPTYERAVEARPTDGKLVAALCEACRNAGQDEKELRYLEWLVKLRPWSAISWDQQRRRLAECYELRHEEEKLVELYRQLGDYDMLHRQLKHKGALSQYIDIMQQEVVSAPKLLRGTLSRTRQHLVAAYLEAGRTEEASILCDSLYDDLMSGGRVDSQGALALGGFCEKLGEFDRGITILERALENPEHAYLKWMRERLASLREKRAAAE
jgi:tetratricopeptide (TPR) repeat protein